ncbi:XrtA system polysaccharide chain length determinant [Rhizorhabdus wittichii]|jgi:polysaccharide chain length determinant protein (PEP-CTERM system associated)|uniref:PEP-CTERM locus polysaccharide chain length determinant n=2 Tax=Rhizorhabdus wittichii TaxID=160791 RepID=A0A9J9HEK4_RHIWR|nr:XrtA system polysaccharide chain length determinant [Rhizorhabdus wittichii]ABQ70376.1 PEP-CTERM locus polysaccharide chain length determinant [Rhizorhabdus wittichii RW1]ARR52670.1 polysaccharide chain length determinant [Rhizorhabdus wittichii DC-6]QTH24075.1 polysaccharide chain length determinant [Rhizorhabdus wittichii]
MEAIYTEIRIALYAIWRMRWLALAVAWAFCLVGWVMVMRVPAAYESSARIQVQVKSLFADGAENDMQRNVDRVRQSLTSTEILKRVVRTVSNGERPLTSYESLSLIGALRSGISITAQGDDLLEIKTRISLKGISEQQTAAIARNVTQKLIEIFIQENVIGSKANNAETLSFLDQELARRAKELAEVDRQRAQITQNTLGSLPGTGSLDQRMDAARNEMVNLDSNLMQARSALAAMNGQLAATPAQIPAGSVNGIDTLDQRIGTLEGQLSEAISRGWTEKHPDVIAIRSQLKQLRAEKARGGSRSVPMAPNPVYVSLKSMQAEREGNVAALQARKSQLEQAVTTIAQRQLTAPGAQIDQARLDRDYDVLKDQYNKLLAQRESAKLRSDATGKTDGVQFRVIDQPSLPRQPAAPNRAMLLTGVLVAGIVIGAGVAFAKSQLANVYTTTQQLAKASGLPVLGSISEVITADTRVIRRKQMMWFSSAAAGLPGMFMLLMLIEFVKRIMVS